MAEDDAVRQLLERAAQDMDGVRAPSVDGLLRRRRRRDRDRRLLMVAATVVAVAGVAVAVSVRATGPATTSHQARDTAVVPASASPTATATTFRDFRWRALPAAPIPVRTGAASVWTGSQMFVWGGSIGTRARSDGALYDPATRRWTVLPPSPLPATGYPQAVAADGSVVVWTGTRGARFDLASRSWSLLATAPPSPAAQADSHLVAVGNLVVVVRAQLDGISRTVQADSYDLHDRTWRRGNRLTTPSGHGLGELAALGVGPVVDVWPGWYHSTKTGPGSSETRSGVDAFQFDPQTGSWRSTDLRPDEGRDATGAIWTGSRVLFPQAQPYCGPCSHPFSPMLTPRLVDPATGARSTIPNGPLGSAGDNLFWTGGALLSYDSHSQFGRSVNPGDLAVWSAATHRWTRLPAAGTRLGDEQDVMLWTGRALLVWGVASEKGTRAGTGGFEFSAP